MNYIKEYNKYKAKYLELKDEMDTQNIQTGGKIFDKRQILYIVATISDPELKRVSKRITDKIIAKNVKPYRDPHITLFHLTINADHPDANIFQDPKFYNHVRSIYDKTIADPKDPLILEAQPFPRDFSLPGYKPRYFIKNYKQQNPDKIFDFRNGIFDMLQHELGKSTIRDDIDPATGARYHVHYYKHKKLFAESRYYDTWKPHLDFLNDFDIEKNNYELSKKLNRYRTNREKADVVANEISSIPQQILESIDMSKQMLNITYALKEGRKELVTARRIVIK